MVNTEQNRYIDRNGILLPTFFWPTVRKNCSSDWEKLLKFRAEGRKFANIVRSLEQLIQTVHFSERSEQFLGIGKIIGI